MGKFGGDPGYGYGGYSNQMPIGYGAQYQSGYPQQSYYGGGLQYLPADSSGNWSGGSVAGPGWTNPMSSMYRPTTSAPSGWGRPTSDTFGPPGPNGGWTPQPNSTPWKQAGGSEQQLFNYFKQNPNQQGAMLTQAGQWSGPLQNALTRAGVDPQQIKDYINNYAAGGTQQGQGAAPAPDFGNLQYKQKVPVTHQGLHSGQSLTDTAGPTYDDATMNRDDSRLPDAIKNAMQQIGGVAQTPATPPPGGAQTPDTTTPPRLTRPVIPGVPPVPPVTPPPGGAPPTRVKPQTH